MKSFSFFTPKGGCGKTTLTILLACYLAYHLHRKVIVLDLEAPTHRIKAFRDKDLGLVSSGNNSLSNYLRDRQTLEPFEIECLGKAINTYKSQDIKDVATRVNSIVGSDNFDFMLIDFPAGYSQMTVMSTLIYNGLLDYVYVPTSLEMQERMEAYNIGRVFLAENQSFRLLWNRLPASFAKYPDIFAAAEKQMADCGMNFATTRVRSFNKATKESDVKCFIRNTLCWPDRYVEMYCPELKNLFREIADDLGLPEKSSY